MADGKAGDPRPDIPLDAAGAEHPARRRALWAVLATVAVAAGALVVSSTGDGDAPPRLPVALGAARAESSGTMAADSSLAWITYVAGEGLAPLGGSAPAYRLEGQVDLARVRSLAEALGLPAESVGEPQDGMWHVEHDGAVLEVQAGTGGSWWYTSSQLGRGSSEPGYAGGGDSGAATSTAECPPGAECQTVEASVPTTVDGCPPGTECQIVEPIEPTTSAACPPDAVCDAPASPVDSGCTIEECSASNDPEPSPPAPAEDLPSRDEAISIARQLMERAGEDVADAEVTADGPYDAWYVSFQHRVDGTVVSGWISSVSVGAEGAVSSASGFLTTAERLGDYPLIDTREAIDRLNEQQGGWTAYATDTATSSSGDQAISTDEAISTTEAHGTDDPGVVEGSSGCAVQPDGSEICKGSGSSAGCAEPAPSYTVCPDHEDLCLIPPDADGSRQPVTTVVEPMCADPVPMPMPEPMPEPQPIEVVLDHAEPALVLMPATDGSGDAYLLPGYRFTGGEGHVVEVVAVADDSLAPTTTAPDTTMPDPTPAPVPEPLPPVPAELTQLEPGQVPEVGVGYYVDGLNTHCGTFTWAERWWATDSATPLPWSSPTEGGTFTLTSPDEGTFVGDGAGTKTATFTARGPAADIPPCA